VTRLLLPRRNLYGALGTEIAALEALEELDLSHNHLSGPIPREPWAKLVNLESLKLEKNLFEGPIPATIVPRGADGKTNLKILDISDNLGLCWPAGLNALTLCEGVATCRARCEIVILFHRFSASSHHLIFLALVVFDMALVGAVAIAVAVKCLML
jgi:hypothetical protein